MNCVKCGKELSSPVCSCGCDHRRETVCFLRPLGEQELEIRVTVQWLEQEIKRKEKELEQLRSRLAALQKSEPVQQLNLFTIANYRQYLQALETYYLELYPTGGQQLPLNRNQILQFIYRHHLDQRWGIVSAEVEKDLQQIYNKYHVQTASNGQKTNPALRIKTYKDYMEVLREIYRDNGGRVMNDQEIRAFLDAYDLVNRFGIRVWDVRVDMQKIAREGK